MINDELRARAQALAPELIKTRRHIHMHPELGDEEYETQKFIISKLDEYGIEHHEYPN